jgi:hypothetical protein
LTIIPWSNLGNTEIRTRWGVQDSMAKYDGIVGKALLTVEEKENELTLVFADNRYLFVKLEDGKIRADSVPE